MGLCFVWAPHKISFHLCTKVAGKDEVRGKSRERKKLREQKAEERCKFQQEHKLRSADSERVFSINSSSNKFVLWQILLLIWKKRFFSQESDHKRRHDSRGLAGMTLQTNVSWQMQNLFIRMMFMWTPPKFWNQILFRKKI